MNTTLRDSALSQTPAEIQGTLGAGNIITDSQRAEFEAGFARPRGGGGEGGGGGTGQPEIGPDEVRPRGGGKGKGKGKGKKGGKSPVVVKGTGRGHRSPGRRVYSPGGTDITEDPQVRGKVGRRGRSPRRSRRSPRRSPRKSDSVGGNTDDRRSTTSRRRSDDFESEPETDGIGGRRTTTSGKRRSRKPKEGEPTYDDIIGGKKPGRRRTESITDEDIRHSQSLLEETVGGLTGGGRRGRGLVGRLRIKNTYDTSWGTGDNTLLEGEDIVDIMGTTPEGGVRLRGTGKAVGKVIPLSVLEEGVRRGDVVLEKGQRRDLGGFWAWSPFSGQEGRYEYDRLYREEARRTKGIYKTDDDAVLRARGHQTVEQRVNAKLQKELDQQRRTEERRKAERDQMRLDDLRHTTTIAQNRRQTAAETAEDIMAVEQQAKRREESAAVSEEEQHKRAQKSVVGREAERLYEFVPDVPAEPSQPAEGLTLEDVEPRVGVEEEPRPTED